MSIDKKTLILINKELNSVSKGFKTNIITKYINKLGVSKHTIYRELRGLYGNKKYVNKEKVIDQKIIELIKDIKLDSIKNNKLSRCISSKKCIEILVKRNIKGSDNLSVSSINRRLREIGFSNKYFQNNNDYKKQIYIKNYLNQIDISLKNIISVIIKMREDELFQKYIQEDLYTFLENKTGINKEEFIKLVNNYNNAI